MFRGIFAGEILAAWRGRQLTLVDPWTPQPAIDYQDIHNVSQAQHQANLEFVHQHLRPHKHRYQTIRATSRAAAAQFEDQSLDFVYIDANHRYPFICEDLATWYSKVREGGFFGGFGYLDGFVDGCLFGIKRAVDEFALKRRLQIRLTYDKTPSWFLLKQTPSRRVAKLNIAMLTAFNQEQQSLAEWSIPNKQQYCARHGYRLIVCDKGFDASRPPAWSKIKFLKEHLNSYEWVFWSDVDSLVMNGEFRLEEFIDEAYDLIISQEDLGVGVYNLNSGQMFFKNSPWSNRFLNEIYAQTQFLNDRLWENRALLHLWEREDLSAHIQVVTQRRFNSYLQNYQTGDFMLHFPDLPNEKRAQLLRFHHQFARP